MKKIYLLLLMVSCCITSFSQNWQTVYSDRVQYYDSSRQAIKIIHKYVDSAGDSVFKNYTQYMIDSSGNSRRIYYGKIVDSTSWTGRKIIIKNNGYNGFANDSNELLWINTLANPGDTFTFAENSRVHIKSICDTAYYADTFGIKDSVKRFKFTFATKPGYKGIFHLDSSRFQVLLSKYHGIIKSPVFSEIIFKKEMVYFNDATFNYFNGNLFTNYNFNNLEVGDEYEFKRYDIYVPVVARHNNVWQYFYQVVEKTADSLTDSVRYKLLVKYYHKDDYFTTGKDPGTTVKLTSEESSVYYETQKRLQNHQPFTALLPNELKNGVKSKFVLDDLCNLRILTEGYGEIDPVTGIFTGPFEGNQGNDYYSKIGHFYWSIDGSVFGGQTPVGLQYRILYTNFCNSQTGVPEIKYTVFPESANEPDNNKTTVYPNPAATTVIITAAGNATIKLTDLQGREISYPLISRDNKSTTLDVSGLANGIYLLQISSGNRIATHQLVIQH